MEQRVIDVRQYPEYAAGHIQGSSLVPLGTLDRVSEHWDRAQPLLVVCGSGRRAEKARQLLSGKGFASVDTLPGGIEAWQSTGNPLQTVKAKPWAMERQVRVAAGALVLGFVTLGAVRSSKFLLGAGLVGAGLVYAGVSNTCMMASVLGRMPWNQLRKAQA